MSLSQLLLRRFVVLIAGWLHANHRLLSSRTTVAVERAPLEIETRAVRMTEGCIRVRL
jgi:hypothetical protein